MCQRREGDVASRFAACRAVLAVEFWREAVQGAGPHVLRRSGGVGSAGGRRAALGGGSYRTGNRNRLANRADSGSAGVFCQPPTQVRMLRGGAVALSGRAGR